MEESNLIIQELEKKIDKLQKSIDRLNKIFFWTMIITVALFVLPLIGLLFVVPQFISTYTNLPSI
jgi:type II secretory pathway component PulF